MKKKDFVMPAFIIEVKNYTYTMGNSFFVCECEWERECVWEREGGRECVATRTNHLGISKWKNVIAS